MSRWFALGARRGVAIALAVGAGGCMIEKPFARTSPFDPGATAEFWIAGPDSVHGTGTRFVMRLEGTAPIPEGDLLIGWRSSAPGMVAGGAGGEFMVMQASTAYHPVTIRAELGSGIVFAKTVMVGQP